MATVKCTCTHCNNEFTFDSARVNRPICPYCGNEIEMNANVPPFYGARNEGSAGNSGYQAYGDKYADSRTRERDRNIGVFEEGDSGKSRGVAGLLALLGGTLGLHYFYLGKTTAGIIFLLVSILSCGFLALLVGLASIVQAIMFFSMPQSEFENKFVYTRSSFPLF